jgi:cell division protein FtsI (penicillin-binding protein 3)
VSRRTSPPRPVRRHGTPTVQRARRAHGRHTQPAARRPDYRRPAPRQQAPRQPAPRRQVERRVVAPRHSTHTAPRFGVGRPRRRLIALLVVLVMVLLLVLARVGTIQTAAQGEELRIQGARQWTRTTQIPASRGTIFDRNGEELAMSVPAATISVNPKLIDDPVSTAATLTAVLGLSQEKHDSLLRDMVERRRGFVYVARQVDDTLGEQIATLRLAGVDVTREDRRTLPGGNTGRSVVGRTDIDGVGLAGLELQYDDVLTGVGGEMTREVAPGARSIPGTEVVSLRPVPGDDLVLTIDRSIQFATEQALLDQVARIGARGATGIVLDTASGEVLSMASVRRNDTTGDVEISSGNFAAVDADEPGSVAKVITIAAAMNEGAVDANTGFEVPWRKQYYDDLLSDAWQHPDEWMTVERILVTSSNIGTIKIWERIGRERHWEYMRAFGLGERTALGFPGESAGILKHWKDHWGSERVTVSYGQGMASTSIQLAAAVNVIANNGIYVAPKLVRSTVGPTGEVTDTPPSATHAVVRPEVAVEMQRMLAEVVCSGTAKAARVDSFNVAGKTGTGLKAQPNGTYLNEQGQRTYYSSFVGFFPAEAPQVTLLISVDEPPAGSEDRFGGTAAAPVFGALAPTIVHELGIQPPAGAIGCGDR